MGSDMRHSTVLVAKRGDLMGIVGKTKNYQTGFGDMFRSWISPTT